MARPMVEPLFERGTNRNAQLTASYYPLPSNGRETPCPFQPAPMLIKGMGEGFLDQA